ncbi:MAG: PIN domain-containing protein [Bifidobacteriaceae bacterium]|nr:PIN domain-containing protein [Bifidobacteriaceae bacterium]
MTREFVDTNVLIYAYGEAADPRHQPAADLVGALGRERRGALSIQVLQEFYVNVTLKAGRPLTPAAARERLRALGSWPCHRPDQDDLMAASELAADSQLAFWDAMIVHSARRLGCAILWTEDLNSGQIIGGVEVRNPFADSPAPQ